MLRTLCPGLRKLVFTQVAFIIAMLAPAHAGQAPNSDPTYQQLRNITLSGESVSVSNLVLKRDAGTFRLRSGTLCFLTPVVGKVTGAVFVGDGSFILDTPLLSERASLKLLTREGEFVESFSQMVLRFTDASYEEIKKAGTPATTGCEAGLLQDNLQTLRKKLRYNLSARILQDVLSPSPDGLFVAFIHGKHYSDKMVYAVDPHGAPPFALETFREFAYALPLAPEEVELMTYEDNKHGYWAAFHLADEYQNGVASGAQKNGFVGIEHQGLDTTIEKNGNLIGKATTTLVSKVNGLRVVPLDLFQKLRVQDVTTPDGAQLSFIQEDKSEDYQFSVILPEPLGLDEKFTFTTTYSGKEAVFNTGSNNYYPVARDNWYPSNPGASFGEYTNYDLTFRIPKGMKMTATGDLVSERNDGNQNVTVWKSEVPQTVAGFNFGKFRVQEAKLTNPDYLVQSYANEDPPDWVQNIQHIVNQELPSEGFHMTGVALGTMGTTPLIKKALAEGELATQLYSDYFGPSSFKRVAITQQTSCQYGQAWPELVWIPMCYFFDTTIRHQLGMDFGDRGYWKIVTSHEIAHQWWGHTVGFNSYRDQWMSEGFAEASASMYLQMIEQNPQKFISFWKDEHELLTERDAQGFRAIDVGPVTMGYRLNNTRAGENVTRRLIYPKGAFILHMLRMMMADNRSGDDNFKQMMRDFVKTYSGKSVTTEDFKAMVEKHMTPEMAQAGGGKMNWFFDEYVYGTALPSYKMDSSFETNADGDVVLNFKMSQANVNDQFTMLVPIYLELADGRIVRLGRVRLMGNNSLEQKVPLKGLKDRPRRALVNYMEDVLASN
jgi:Peptidase family M1 domain